ncbi:MAG: type II secretion system major pseudopilin GspG [Fimbriimonadaceae bacterium]|nr:type II secretion system major pseudopilin GspG [Fimbriimonadaceae bacterium]
MRRSIRRRRAALTLIELLVVMMILSILATAVALSVVNKVHLAKVNAGRADLATFDSALEQYNLVMGAYPTTEQGLQALVEPPSGADEKVWRTGGPFIKKQNFLDPWGNSYVYNADGDPGSDRPYEVVCYGGDGKAGGEGKDADLSNLDNTRGGAKE